MKRFLLIFCLALFINACDDGEVTVSSFNFDNATINKCNNVLYKLNKNEVLFLSLPDGTFKNELTADALPVTLNINSVNGLIYRMYNTTLSTASFCTTIPPSGLAVTDEWFAREGVDKQSGVIQITTTAVSDEAGTITGYNHEIRLINVAFSNAKSQFVLENYLFGNYVTTL